MNQRNLKLDGYGIAENQYAELHKFCLQYPFTGQPRGDAEKALIEQTAREVDPEAFQLFLRAIIRGLPPESVPRGRNQFYARRREFYFRLAQKKGLVP